MCGNCPIGTDYDPNAPWNEPSTVSTSREVEYSCTMLRTANIETTDNDNVSSAELLNEYKDIFRTPQQLINTLHDIATAFADGCTPKIDANEWKRIAVDSAGWETEDEYAEEQ